LPPPRAAAGFFETLALLLDDEAAAPLQERHVATSSPEVTTQMLSCTSLLHSRMPKAGAGTYAPGSHALVELLAILLFTPVIKP
jgi:hypothetical protein